MPAQLDPDALARCCLALGDDALIYSHRLQQWVARLPELEEETAVANIALDLLGQARLLLSRAGGIAGQTEDQLAFFREEKEFRNVRLAEHADRDFAELVVRLLIFSAWRLALFEELVARRRPTRCSRRSPPRASTSSPTTATTPPAGWSASATAPRCRTPRPQAALDTLWPLVGELFRPDPDALATVDPGAFDAVLDTVLATAGLDRPTAAAARPGRRPDRPRRRAHRGDGLHPGRAPVRRPRPPGRDLVTAVTEQTHAYDVAAGTPDPEIPMLTIEDLGILRSVDHSPAGESS